MRLIFLNRLQVGRVCTQEAQNSPANVRVRRTERAEMDH